MLSTAHYGSLFTSSPRARTPCLYALVALACFFGLPFRSGSNLAGVAPLVVLYPPARYEHRTKRSVPRCRRRLPRIHVNPHSKLHVTCWKGGKPGPSSLNPLPPTPTHRPLGLSLSPKAPREGLEIQTERCPSTCGLLVAHFTLDENRISRCALLMTSTRDPSLPHLQASRSCYLSTDPEERV